MSSGRSESLAEIIRRERLTHAWTQEQLALVASVNLRTVQRVERGLPCSGETKQALAGALNLDAGVLAAATNAADQGRRRFGLTGSQAVWAGATMCLPGLIFVLLNVAYYEIEVGILEPIMRSGAWSALTSYPLTPVILIAGPVLSLLLNLPHLVTLRVRQEQDAAIVDGVVVNYRPMQWTVAGLALIIIAIMVAYGAVEFLGHLLHRDQPGWIP